MALWNTYKQDKGLIGLPAVQIFKEVLEGLLLSSSFHCLQKKEGKDNLVIKLVGSDSRYQSSIPASKCTVIQII